METVINYIAAGLLVLVIILGFTTYIAHEDVTRLKAEGVELTTKLRTSEANVLLAQKSCEATQVITNGVSAKIETKQEQMTKTLVDLVALPTAKDSNDGKKFADDASLSPELMRLLDKAYCDASPADATCTASRANANMPRKTGTK